MTLAQPSTIAAAEERLRAQCRALEADVGVESALWRDSNARATFQRASELQVYVQQAIHALDDAVYDLRREWFFYFFLQISQTKLAQVCRDRPGARILVFAAERRTWLEHQIQVIGESAMLAYGAR